MGEGGLEFPKKKENVITKVCFGCGKNFGEKEGTVEGGLTHGLCPECAKLGLKRKETSNEENEGKCALCGESFENLGEKSSGDPYQLCQRCEAKEELQMEEIRKKSEIR